MRLAIYNVLGQRTRTLVDRYIAPGSHTVIWDGVGDTGDASASGVYVVRLEHVDREGELRSNSQTNSTARRVRGGYAALTVRYSRFTFTTTND